MKILIVKTSSLGDLLHAFPALSYLRERFPQARIDWLVEQPFSSLLQAHPQISTVIPIDTRKWKKTFFSTLTWKEVKKAKQAIQETEYDLVFDLQGNIKSAIFTYLSRAKVKVGFAKDSLPEWPNQYVTDLRYDYPKGCNIRDDYLSIVKQHFSDEADFVQKGIVLNTSAKEKASIEPYLKEKHTVLVCPGSAWPNKQMNFEGLVSLLSKDLKSKEAYFLFAWGSEEEKSFAQRLQKEFSEQSLVLDRLSLAALQLLMTRVDLVIAMDSLALHLCGTTDTASFSIFGPSSMEKYKPLGAQHKAYQGSCPYGNTFEKRCAILRTCKTGACMKEIKSESIECMIDGSSTCGKK